MKPDTRLNDSPLCPSAQPNMANSFAFGVIGGTVEQPAVKYFAKPEPVTDELLALAEPVKPTEVFRFAASCEAKSCQHFDGNHCQLAARVVEKFPAVAETLPPCTVRSHCRWWQQEGKAACLRCPQVVTELYQASEVQVEVATPVEI